MMIYEGLPRGVLQIYLHACKTTGRLSDLLQARMSRDVAAGLAYVVVPHTCSPTIGDGRDSDTTCDISTALLLILVYRCDHRAFSHHPSAFLP